jgi:hypothetical protein
VEGERGEDGVSENAESTYFEHHNGAKKQTIYDIKRRK